MTDLEAAILDVLEKGPSYGLAIFEALPEAVRPTVSLFSTLRSMEDKGWVRSWYDEPLPEHGDRPRRYYAVTEAGQAAREAEEHFRAVVSF